MGLSVLTIEGDDMGTTLAEENRLGCVGIWCELGPIVKFCRSPQTTTPWPRSPPLPIFHVLLCNEVQL